MDGKGCYHDNIFVERLWRSVKHECVYLTAFEDGRHLKQALHRYFRHYNQTRYHQTLDYQTPDEVYYQQPDRKSTRQTTRHVRISYAVFCLKKKKYIKRSSCLI